MPASNRSTTMADDTEEEDAPLAIVTTVRDLAKWMPPGIAETYGQRPAWFLLEMDAELVTIFEQIPEDPIDHPGGILLTIANLTFDVGLFHNP